MKRREFGLAVLSVGLGAGCNPLTRYLSNAKTSEAKNTVGQIARALAASGEKEKVASEVLTDGKASPPPGKRFPPSAPRVPKDVPKGAKYQPSATDFDHPSWKEIKFRIDQPVYYAYEFETAADGQSAVVRAIGDLDGNGKTSKFELEVKLVGGNAEIAKQMKIENEFE